MEETKIRFMLDGCDISFIAEAPKDMTVEQLVRQASRIKPDWCACGIRNLEDGEEKCDTDIIFDYNNVQKADEDISCKIGGLI